jgi:hypothetical protein
MEARSCKGCGCVIPLDRQFTTKKTRRQYCSEVCKSDHKERLSDAAAPTVDEIYRRAAELRENCGYVRDEDRREALTVATIVGEPGRRMMERAEY